MKNLLKMNQKVTSHYWYLGLMFLLEGMETEAQTTWFMAMAEEDEERIEDSTDELVKILETEAERQKILTHYQNAFYNLSTYQRIKTKIY